MCRRTIRGMSEEAQNRGAADHSQLGAALRRVPRAGVIHQDPPHGLGSRAEKMGPILPLHLGAAHQAEICLVDQRGRLQGVIGPLPPHGGLGDAVELLIEQGQEPVHRDGVPWGACSSNRVIVGNWAGSGDMATGTIGCTGVEAPSRGPGDRRPGSYGCWGALGGMPGGSGPHKSRGPRGCLTYVFSASGSPSSPDQVESQHRHEWYSD